ncbi:hypothetical protein BN6_67040 [Saccharothrix espanaensis DSM 44229]|uniref:Peptidase C14 caspase domain-containing protein n=1 Tax=Saccharothrix espanaensis (strain ATCC 51144 / DSM 44229 / JCM 9112 / NBRC 15066 / NRRL 15764) TaxID=1179773 RepID=K0K6H8_SACES|nr:hypothetical protein BN6_67040 [Saccharothrix espanaensis DSM 44229]
MGGQVAVGRFALLIGTNAYADPAYPQLWSPVDDVRRLAAVLRDPDLGGFEVTSCVDRPASEVRYEVAGIAADKRAEDTVLVYISGPRAARP